MLRIQSRISSWTCRISLWSEALPGQHQQRTGILSRVTAMPITICGRSSRDWHAKKQHAQKAAADTVLRRIPAVLLYFPGENRWRGFEQLPAPAAHRTWYLADGGRLLDHPGSNSRAAYDYDPLDPVPTVGGATMIHGFRPGPADQRRIEARGDVLTYTSEPLTAPLTLFGEVRATFHASSSAPDTDFVVRLCKVSRDGVSIGLNDGRRARLLARQLRHRRLPPRPPAGTTQTGARVRVHRQPAEHRLHPGPVGAASCPGDVQLPPPVGPQPQHRHADLRLGRDRCRPPAHPHGRGLSEPGRDRHALIPPVTHRMATAPGEDSCAKPPSNARKVRPGRGHPGGRRSR